MEPQVGSDVETDGQTTEPLCQTAEGLPVFPEWDESDPPPLTFTPDQEIEALDRMTDAELLAEAGIEPIVSTTEAAEYFDRTSQWIYWGLKPDENTGERIFVWPDGSPIIPERIGDPLSGRRRFTTPILRAILAACYRRGNITDDELKIIIRRIRYTELGVEWRQREGWKFADLGRNRHRWVKPENAYFDRKAKTWRLRKDVKVDKGDQPLVPVTEDDFIDVEVVSVENE